MFKGRIALISNYIPDRQFSMLQYAELLYSGLVNQDIDITKYHPQVCLGKFLNNKWTGYIDKIILFRLKLKSIIKYSLNRGSGSLVHICDHSNSYYSSVIQGVPVVITCHDLMAIRAAEGEFGENCPGVTGKLLQRMIKGQLKYSDYFVCDSRSTQIDLNNLVPSSMNRSTVVYPGFYKRFSRSSDYLKIEKLSVQEDGYILHVGSNAWYKNRIGVLQIYQNYLNKFSNEKLKCVFVGPELDDGQVEFIKRNNLNENVYVLKDISHEELVVLYSFAKALVFPSIFEGFGWPPLEAQSCDCPVICSNEGSLKEVVGDSALVSSWDDTDSHVKHLNQIIKDSQTRQSLIEKGRVNVTRFTNDRMIEDLCEVYRQASLIRK